MGWIDAALLPLSVMAGAFATVIFGMDRRMPSATKRLKGMFPGHEEAWYARRDFALVWLIGVAAGYFLFRPIDLGQGFMAGLGSVSTIRAAAGKYIR
jgi:hypothetical protein